MIIQFSENKHKHYRYKRKCWLCENIKFIYSRTTTTKFRSLHPNNHGLSVYQCQCQIIRSLPSFFFSYWDNEKIEWKMSKFWSKNTHMHTINKCFFYFLNFCAKKRFGIERGEIFEIFFCILKLKLNCGWNLEIWKFFLNWTWLEKFYSFGQPKTKNNRQQLNQIWIMVTNWIEKKIELNENKKTSTEQNRTGFDGYQITQWQCCVYLGCKLTTKLNGNAPNHNHHHHHHKQQQQQQPSALNIRFSR